MQKKDIKNHYFIKDLENISGIKAHTIRIWEQRYKILTPERTNTGLRFYNETQLNHLLNIVKLVGLGNKISSLALLSEEEVTLKCQKTENFSPLFEDFFSEFIKKILNFDEDESHRHLSFYHLKNGTKPHLKNVLFPLINHLFLLFKNKTIKKIHLDFANQILIKHLNQIFTENNSEKSTHLLIIKDNDSLLKFDSLIWKNIALNANRNALVLYHLPDIKDLEVLKIKNEINKIFIVNLSMISGLKIYLHNLRKLFPKAAFAHFFNDELINKDSNLTLIKTIKDYEDWIVKS